ncbi:MAG: hypothetical protein HFJ55_03500 [Clostridia bacterium]|jgi:hypothetical protein|nr:hypothetical protein [Clostridia bacterium]
MELKTKYQYTYFIYPYVIKEAKYSKYLLRLLKDKNCKLRIFRKDKDLDIYSYFSHRVRDYMFNSFNLSKTRLLKLDELPLDTKAAILAKNGCTIFEYTMEQDIQGITAERDGIYFKIPKIEIICFNTGICFLCIKTNISGSNQFTDVLNFNYKFRDINQEYSNMKNYDNIRVQTDYFSDVKYFKEFIRNLTGSNIEAMKLDINTERFLTYSYTCIDQEGWNSNNEFEKIKENYMKYLNILSSDNSINYSREDMKIISKWKYAKLGVTKQGVTLFCSSCDINNYTVFPQEFQDQYLYTYILAMYMKIYLKKINLEFRQEKKIKKTRKEFIKFTQNLWINEVTQEDTGALYYQYLKDVLELYTIFDDTKNKYDILYKELNIERNSRVNAAIIALLALTLCINAYVIMSLLE